MTDAAICYIYIIPKNASRNQVVGTRCAQTMCNVHHHHHRHKPTAIITVIIIATSNNGSTAVLDYHYSGNDVKGKISNSSLSATGLTRQQSDLLVDDTFNRQPTITYHAEKRNGKWCVLNK